MNPNKLNLLIDDFKAKEALWDDINQKLKKFEEEIKKGNPVPDINGGKLSISFQTIILI